MFYLSRWILRDGEKHLPATSYAFCANKVLGMDWIKQGSESDADTLFFEVNLTEFGWNPDVSTSIAGINSYRFDINFGRIGGTAERPKRYG